MSVSLCVLRLEIDEDLPEMGDNPAETEAAKEQKRKDRGNRETKTITVETYASVLVGQNPDNGLLPTSSRRSPGDSVSEDDEMIAFFCGNPLVEVTKGVLHLYKENELKESPSSAKMLCLLSVPGALGARDLLAFAAACQQDIAHVRVLRDGSPDHYMALLTFRTAEAAREFHSAFDGVPYTSLEPGALCHAAWVSRVEWARDGAPPPSHTELPTCPVCLERMDESVAGVLSVQCAHAFHANCLLRWSDCTCPVCRCSCTPEPRRAAVCSVCRDTEGDNTTEQTRETVSGVAEGLLDGGGVEAGALWICLICGHVGCGRYEGGHAAKHYMQSKHTYALQLGSNRVWDYAGDNFVHRLVQNKTDGKLVAVGRAGSPAREGGEGGEARARDADKLDAAQLEFTYILTSQLDTQREHYRGKIAKLEAAHSTECEALRERAAQAESVAAALRGQLDTLARENKGLDRKLHHLTAKVSTLASELSEERDLAAALASNQAEWQARAGHREEGLLREIADLKEQLRDVMFFVSARGQLAQAPLEVATQEEITSASVTVSPPAPAPGRGRRRARR